MKTTNTQRKQSGLVEIEVLLAVVAFWLIIDLTLVAPSAMGGPVIPGQPIPVGTIKW